MAQGYVTLKVRITAYAKELLLSLARASDYKTAAGTPDVGRVIDHLLESEVARVTWPKHRAHEEGYASLQEAVEDHQHVARIASKRNASIRRRRRREAMATLKRIK